MTATLMDNREAFLNSDAVERAPNTPSVPAEPPEPDLGLARRLLTKECDQGKGNALRVALGVGGLFALGLVPTLAQIFEEGFFCQVARTEATNWLGFQLAALPAGAALTLTFALPGLLILLSILDEPLQLGAMFNALARAYYRLGLLGFGAAPTLALYALTGADAGWITFTSVAVYFAAGGTALLLLMRDFIATLTRRRGLSRLLVFGWGAFACVLGLYFFIKFNFWMQLELSGGCHV